MDATMWEQEDLIHPRTLLFPPPNEVEFLREHTGGRRARLFIRNVFLLFVLFTLLLGAFSVFLELSSPGYYTDEVRVTTYTTVGIVGFVSVFGALHSWLCPEDQWVAGFQIKSIWAVPLPVLLIYFIVFLSVLRFERYTAINFFFDTFTSYFQVFVVVIMCLTGTAMRYVSAAIFFIPCLALVVGRGVAFFFVLKPVAAIVHFFNYLAPCLCAIMMVWWRFAGFERVVRLEFLSYKRLQVEMSRQIEQRKTLANLLDIMLPKSVIPRLIDSNFKFSNVSDRFDNAFCLFVDFFLSDDLKDQDFEVTATLLNETFKTFDLLLKNFPEVEKIKTIGSKALLVCHPPKDSLERHAEIITLLSWEVITKMFSLNQEEMVSVQSALLYQLPEVYDFPKRHIRIGIAFGPIVAGIVGEEKFCYDVYGDTVNVASRLQSLGLGHVLASKDFFDKLTPSKRVQRIKGRGEMEVYELQHPFVPRPKAKRNTFDNAAPPPPPPVSMRRRVSSSTSIQTPAAANQMKRHLNAGLNDALRKPNRASPLLGLVSQVTSCNTPPPVSSDTSGILAKLSTKMTSSVATRESQVRSAVINPGSSFIQTHSIPSGATSASIAVLNVSTPTSTTAGAANATAGVGSTPPTAGGNGMASPTARLSAISVTNSAAIILSTLTSGNTPAQTRMPQTNSFLSDEVRSAGHSNNLVLDVEMGDAAEGPQGPQVEEAETKPRDSDESIPAAGPPAETGSLLAGMNTLALAQSASIIASNSTSNPEVDGCSDSVISTAVDPFQPIIAKVHPLLTEGRAQELYEAVGNFLVPWQLVFKETRIEYIFRRSKAEAEAFINAQHSMLGVVAVWVLILTAAMGDSLEREMGMPQPYIYSACFFGLMQVGIAGAQVELLWGLGRKVPPAEKYSSRYLAKSTLSVSVRKNRPNKMGEFFSNSLIGYALNIMPFFGLCITLCLFSGYGRFFSQSSGAIMQNFIIYTLFMKCSIINFIERLIIGSVLLTIIIIANGVVGGWQFYDISTTVGCHLLLLVVLHRMECVMRTDFLLRETLFISKAVSDRQTKLSTGLLNAILPQRIMKKLIQNIDLADKSAIIDFFDCNQIEPDALIKILNTVFSAFDKICRAHGVEKIITVGDAYIAAHLGYSKGEPHPYTQQIAKSLGFDNLEDCLEDDQAAVHVEEKDLGLPKVVSPRKGNPNFAAALCSRTALAMIAALEEMASSGTAFVQVPGARLLIRAGVHSGTARGFVTGGYTKIKYELFGEAVDTAEKVQEIATPGTVFASKRTIELLQENGKFDIDPDVKGTSRDGSECFHIKGLVKNDKDNLGMLAPFRYYS
ncbi:hypothetical protein HDU96_003436 [Phlyctochytrium bullatum]|nr:hypothetical protein HDU96_003436 [Phlyctochytrium bullatum]